MPDSEVPETHFCNNHRGCDYGEADLEALLKYRADCRGKANKRKYEQSDLGKATIPIRGTPPALEPKHQDLQQNNKK